MTMLEIFQDKKVLVILGLIGVFLIYRFFLRDSNKNSEKVLENEYNKILNSEDNKVKGQWD